VAPAPTDNRSQSDLGLTVAKEIQPVDTRVEQAGEGAAAQHDKGAGTPPSSLQLKLTLGYRHDNNLFASASAPVSDFVRSLAPGATWTGAAGKHRYRLGYQGQWANHARFHSEDHQDHAFDGTVALDLHRKFKVEIDTGIEFGTDARGGLTSRQVTFGERDKWRRHHLGASAQLGRRIATAQLIASARNSGIRYRNNRQSSRDTDTLDLGLEGRWNFSPRLSAIAAGGVAANDYQDPATPLDSREYEALIGVEWEATAKTSGRVLVGSLWKDFDDPSRRGFHGRNWEAEVNWEPRSYSKLTAYASRDATESAFGGTGTAILDTYGLKWRHALSNRWVLNAGFEFSTSDLDGGNSEDQFLSSFGFSYSITRWLDFGVNYESIRRRSNPGNRDFGDQSLGIEFTGSWDTR
jgi:hypothetical protein